MIKNVNSFYTNVNSGVPLQDMVMLCAGRNASVLQCYEKREMNLDEFLSLQASKVTANRNCESVFEPEDFYQSALNIIESRLSKEAGELAEEVLRKRVISTADHHGSVFCSQSFQGDILYAFLLKKLGINECIIPIITGGQVELGNVTYSRGISLYTSDEKKELLPFFRKMDHNQMAIKAAPIDSLMLKKFRKKFVDANPDTSVKSALDEILTCIYESEEVQKDDTFAKQTTVIGEKLSRILFHEEYGFSFAYLEVESVIQPLLIKEIEDEKTLFGKIVRDRKARKLINESFTEDGISVASQLFVGADDKGRKVFLNFSEDGLLTGESMDGSIITYDGDTQSLTELIKKKLIYPGLFTAAIILAFERGITWMGGMFQSVYLPSWQKCVVKLFDELGLKKAAELIMRYDCTGYISGPMFALYGGNNYATTAGPVEMWMAKSELSRIKSLVDNTTLWNSHMIGLHEMYPDLTSKDEREENWYKTVAMFLYDEFAENIIYGGAKNICLG